jgi:hypothetical protein
MGYGAGMIDRAEAIARLPEPLRGCVEACLAMLARLDDPEDRTMLVAILLAENEIEWLDPSQRQRTH